MPDSLADPRERRELENALTVRRLLDDITREFPSAAYVPHSKVTHPRSCRPMGSSSGQLQFHQATHPIRIAAPGNGWGGTIAMGCEIDNWCRHTNRWQKTPDWPIIAVWFCPLYKQFDILRPNLERMCFGVTPRFQASNQFGARYIWPDGSQLYLASADNSWKHLQGIELDLVAFDEQPPPSLFREMTQRRRGRRKTRYICKATQTGGWSWMADEIYTPWLAYHRERGLTEDEALDAQLHPDVWLWSKGGIHDNPGADESDVVWYERRPWPTKKERKVRLYGGFESWVGDSVFEEETLEYLEARARVLAGQYPPPLAGFLEIDPEGDLRANDPGV